MRRRGLAQCKMATRRQIQQRRCPLGCRPCRDGDSPAQPPSDPLAFLSESGTPAAPSIAPPPIPDDAEVDGGSSRQKAGVDLLAGYRRRSKPKSEQIKEKFKHGVNAFRKKGAALKLQHEVTSLQTAVDGQLEILGTLLLTHRPPAVRIQAELAELSQIQDELARKETTIESLRQTKGGGSAVKELEAGGSATSQPPAGGDGCDWKDGMGGKARDARCRRSLRGS